MVVRTTTTIQLKAGVTAKLLLTPALYGIAKERGITLFAPARENQDPTERMVDQYSRIAYCAAICAWEVDSVDDPGKGPFPHTFEDFHTWAWNNPKELGRTIDEILRALTGKSARDYARTELEAEAENEKKKMRKGKNRPIWITARSKPSS